MERDFGGWQLEDQPSLPRIDGSKHLDVAKKCPASLRIGAVEENMRSIDHGESLPRTTPTISSGSALRCTALSIYPGLWKPGLLPPGLPLRFVG